jgi:hypothetical protein
VAGGCGAPSQAFADDRGGQAQRNGDRYRGDLAMAVEHIIQLPHRGHSCTEQLASESRQADLPSGLSRYSSRGRERTCAVEPCHNSETERSRQASANGPGRHRTSVGAPCRRHHERPTQPVGGEVQ